MSHRKDERNKDLIEKREQGWSYGRLAKFYRIQKSYARQIYERDKNRFNDRIELSTDNA